MGAFGKKSMHFLSNIKKSTLLRVDFYVQDSNLD